MISGREAISAAAFALLQTINPGAGVKTFSRRLISSADLGSTQMPALIFLVKSEHAAASQNQPHALPIRWKIEAEVFVFVSTADPGIEPEAQLNNLIDAIEAVLAPGPSYQGRQTLGSLVYDFRINGTIEREPGFISGVGAAAVPIEITTTS